MTRTSAHRDNSELPTSPDHTSNPRNDSEHGRSTASAAQASRDGASTASTRNHAAGHPLGQLLPQDSAERWLNWQCRMVAGVIQGAVIEANSQNDQQTSLASWSGIDDHPIQFNEVVNEAIATAKPLVHNRNGNSDGNHYLYDLIACPIRIDQDRQLVVCCALTTRPDTELQAVLQLLQWGAAWLETLVQQQFANADKIKLVDQPLIASILQQNSLQQASFQVVNGLAEQFQCERVSLGLRHGIQTRIVALSGSSGFDRRSELVRQIEAAMSESLDQSSILVLPSREGSDAELAISSANAHLLEQQRSVQVCSLPIPGRDSTIGVLTLEMRKQALDEQTIDSCARMLSIIGPALALLQADEKSLTSRLRDSAKQAAHSFTDMQRLKPRLAIGAAVIGIVTLALLNSNYRVTAPASIEAAAKQTIVAPVDGYVKSSHLRAGDTVSSGDLIAAIDDRALVLEQEKWRSEYRKIENEYQDALASRDLSRTSILASQLNRVSAEKNLIDQKLERTRLSAPFDGVIVSGDLSQALGSPVEIGQVLFEVAPVGEYRVAIEIDEYDMDGINQAQGGQLILASMPRQPFSFELDKIIPIATAADGRNYFRVEARLTGDTSALRPGMRGVAKVDMGERKLLWSWLRSTYNKLYIWAWSIGL